MRVLPIGIEHALDVLMNRPQHADSRMHQQATPLRGHDQHFGSSLFSPGPDRKDINANEKQNFANLKYKADGNCNQKDDCITDKKQFFGPP
jgi:hypothetical protein